MTAASPSRGGVSFENPDVDARSGHHERETFATWVQGKVPNVGGIGIGPSDHVAASIETRWLCPAGAPVRIEPCQQNGVALPARRLPMAQFGIDLFQRHSAFSKGGPVPNGSSYRACPNQIRVTVCLTVSPMFITSSIVRAHSLCLRKAFLLLYPDTSQSTERSHAYVQILEERAQVNQVRHIAEIRERSGTPCPSDANLLTTGPDFLVNVSIRSSDLEAHCDVLTKAKTSSGLGRYSYDPTIVTGTYSPTLEQKTDLSFTAYVLGQVQKTFPVAGTLLNRGKQAQKILLTGSYISIKTILRTLRGWIASPPPEPPPVIFNKHCPYCQFRKECTELAIRDDNLTLLDRMTPPLIKKYNKKGIFTVIGLCTGIEPCRPA